MAEGGPVVEISARFPDEASARVAADALNRWFRWIVSGSAAPVPKVFEPFGVATAEWAWSLDEDVDWELGPHARAAGAECRVAIETRDTHLRLAGLLRSIGGHAVRMVRDEGRSGRLPA
jgi:hypothetical protein